MLTQCDFVNNEPNINSGWKKTSNHRNLDGLYERKNMKNNSHLGKKGMFKVSALKKLDMVGRHSHFILSKYFI